MRPWRKIQWVALGVVLAASACGGGGTEVVMEEPTPESLENRRVMDENYQRMQELMSGTGGSAPAPATPSP